MATRKTASTAKKRSTAKRANAPVAKKTTTKTRVVSAGSSRAASANKSRVQRFSFSRAPLLSAAIAELIGTFTLAAVILITSGEPIYAMFALVGIVLTIGTLSGAHVNPAMTVGAWVTRKITSGRAVAYIVAQILGAMLALVVINAYVHSAPAVTGQAQMLGQSSATLYKAVTLPTGKEWAVFASELLGTALYAFAYASAMREKRDQLSRAFTIAGGLFVGLLVATAVSGYISATAALNPAIAFSLQAVSWKWMPILVYVAAPLIAGVLGFGLYDLLRDEDDA